MSDRDILDEFGSDSGAGQKPRASNGGHMPVTPTKYSPPSAEIPMSQKPGIGGTNHGQCGTQGKH